jgi:uncharacterized repeat protein (TIGR01451 family)
MATVGRLVAFALALMAVVSCRLGRAEAAGPPAVALTMSVRSDAPTGEFTPGAPLTYLIRVDNPGVVAIGPLTLDDTLPPEVVADGVVTPVGTGSVSPDGGRVTVTDLVIAPGGSVSIGVLATLRSVDALVALGRPFPTLDGLSIAQQASISDPGDPLGTPRLSDDPGTPAVDDPTAFALSARVDLAATRKTVEDVNGGDPAPGDTLRFTLTLENQGTVDSPVLVDDPPPAGLLGCNPVQVPAELACDAGGLRGEIIVPAGGVIVVTYTMAIDPAAAHAQQLRNVANVTSSLDPSVTLDAAARVLRVVSLPVLTATKIAVGVVGGRVETGSAFTFEIQVRNTGNRAATGLVVTDTFNVPATVQAVPLDGGQLVGGQLQWTRDTLAPGDTATFRLQVTVGADTVAPAVLRNQAFVTAVEVPRPVASDDPGLPGAADVTVVNVEAAPARFTVSKRVVDENGGAANPGDILRYDLTVTADRATVLAAGPDLTDALPAELALVEALGAEIDAAGVTWRLPADWPEGQAFSGSLRAQVVEGTPDGARISNQALLVGLPAGDVASDDPTTAAAGDATVIRVVGAPAAGVALKSVTDENGGQVLPGDTLRYHFTVANTGSAASRAPQVVDDLADGLTFVAADLAPAVAGRRVTWRLAPLAAGAQVEFDLRVTVNADVAAGTTLRNQATVSLGGGSPPVATDDPATPVAGDATSVQVQAAAGPVLVASKTLVAPADGVYGPGDEVTYGITLENRGGAPTARLEIVDPLDQNLTGTFAENGQIDAAGRSAAWGVPPIAPGAVVQFTLRARIGAGVAIGTRISNQYGVRPSGGGAFVRSDDPTTAAGDDPVVFVVGEQMQVAPAARCELRWSRPDARAPAPGESVSYRFTCVNTGAVALDAMTLRAPLPQALTYVARSTRLNAAPVADGPGGAAPVAGGLGLLDPPPLFPGNAVTVTFDALVRPGAAPGTVVAYQGSLTTDGGLLVQSDDPDTAASPDPTRFTIASPQVAAPGLTAFRKTFRVVDAADPTRAAIGDVIEWTLDVRNDGTADATRVTVTDPMPARTQYVAGSMTADGVPLTDAADADAADFGPGGVTFTRPRLRAGELWRLTFRTAVLGGPRVQNQARLTATEVPPESSDDDANEANGNGPTVVPVGDTPVAALAVEKVAEPSDDGTDVGYALTVRNLGSTALRGVTLVDDLPAGVDLSVFPEAPAGATVNYLPPSRRLTIAGLRLAPGAEASFRLRATIDPALPAGTRLCNVFDARADGVAAVDSAPACFEVAPRVAAVQGAVYQDADGVAGVAVGTDLPLAGVTVRLSSEAGAVFEARSGADGRYALEGVPAGRYTVEAVTSARVTVARNGLVALVPGGQRVDVQVSPSGRLYQSRTGALLDGVRLYLYRDRDAANDDVFDAASRARRELVAGRDLEDPSQQGQVTSTGGLYRFAPRRAGRYFIEADAPATLVWPSLTRPSRAGFLAASGAPPSADALPVVTEDAGPEWSAAFETDGVADIRQNHLPLDPIESLLEIQKRALKGEATVGDILTYEIDITNRSPRDLVYSAGGRRGGVYIEDDLPPGFRYVAGSAAVVRVGEQGEQPLLADDPGGSTQLRFGEVRREGGRNVLRPLSLRAGSHLRLRYQAVIGANVQPRQRYTNRARLLSSEGTPLGPDATAAVVVVSDPDLDQSVLIGKVFCDADADGEQGEGEAGLPGAMVLADSGDFAITDSAGKFHFQALEAGTHAFKLDTDSLLPGGTLTTDETRILSLTRGLPAKIGFGVTCPATPVSSPVLELAPEGFVSALGALKKSALVVTGNVRAQRIHVDGLDFKAGAPEVHLIADGLTLDAPDLHPGGRGVTAELAFDVRVPDDAPQQRWALWVGPLGGAEQIVATGDGAPPDTLPWDQRGLNGERILEKGHVYAFRLEVSDTRGRTWGSPAGVFGVGAHFEADPPLVAALRGTLFTPQGEPDPSLDRELRKLLPRLKKLAGTLRVEMHGDDALPPAEMQVATTKQAELAAARLTALLAGAGPKVVAVGMGTARPLAPNLSERQRARNRRLELRHVASEDPTGKAAAGPPRRTVDLSATYAPVARIGRDEAPADVQGEFAMTAAVPPDGVLEVSIRDVDGRRAVIPVRRHAGAPAAVGTPRVVALAGTAPDALTLGGRPLPLPGAAPTLTGPTRLEANPQGRLAPTTMAAGTTDDVAEWSVVVLAPQGREMFRAAGQGRPPRDIILTGVQGPWLPGDYTARLTTRGRDASAAQSAPWRMHMGPGGPASPATGPWRVFLDGRAVQADATGRLFGEAVVRDGGRVLVEVVSPEGATRAFFVLPPGDTTPAAVGPVARTTPGTATPTADGPQATVAAPVQALAAPTSAPASLAAGGTYPKVDPAPAPASGAPSGDYARVEEPTTAPAPTYERVDDALAPSGTQPPTRYRRVDELNVGAPTAGAAPGPVDDLGLHAYRPDAPEGSPAAPPPPRRAMAPAARAELDAFGRAELLRALAPQVSQSGAEIDVPARRLSVDLPAEGVALAGRTLPIRGTTDPENRVFVNGVEFPVGAEGQFGGAAVFPPGRTTLEIAAVDTQGNRGVIRREVAPADAQWFLLALGDSAAGLQQNELDGTSETTRVNLGDTAYLHGRGVGWLRGRVQGKEILDGAFEEYEVEAHVDTARRRTYEPAFRSMIDPERFYPTYGDSAVVENSVHTRGPVYVLVRADESKLTVGDFQSDVKGLELFRYDRSLYGAQLKLDKETGPDARWHHEANAYVADLDAPERHAYVELRGTGGSLYYLPYEELIEGSERVYLIERDRETGIERQRRVLVRDADYSIRYREGRILVKTPVPRVTLDSFGPRPQAVNGRRGEVLGGHPVYLAVEMDHRDPTTEGEMAFGAHVRETFEGALTLGGGYLEEGQSRDAASRYRLWGAEAGAHYGRRTRLETEWVQSRNGLGSSLYSDDGGLTYEPFHGRTGEGARGTGMLIRGGLELDDLIGAGDRDHWYTEGYWQYLAPGFYSGGTLQSQGLEKYGALTRYTFNEQHSLRLQHDGVVADEPETQGDMAFHGFRRNTTLVGHTYTDGPLTLDTTFAHTEDDEGGEEPPFVTDVLNVGAEYGLTAKWTLIAGQEIVVRGDNRLHASTTDLLATTVGARYRPTTEVSIEGTETVRWSGDNATQIGLRTEVDDRHTVYVNERFAQQDGKAGATSVVGGEERWGEDQSGRSYGEYQLEAGELGARNRAVLGLGKRTKIIKGLTLDAGYERSQVLGGAENGELSSDTVSLGSEWLDSKRVKISGRYELRYDDNSEEVGRRDRLQFLTLNGADWLLTPDFTFLVRLNYSHTYDLAFEATEAEMVEGSLGLAFRPIAWDDFAALIKYTKRYEQRPTDLLVELPIRDEYDVVSLVPVLELPWHFQLVEKLALKRMATRTLNLPTVVSQTLLWINRLNYHITQTWDAGAEYRLLTTTLAAGRKHGALGEVNYIIQKKVRLGVGYNFTSFSDDEFARLDEDHGGPFFRVIANY